MKWHTRIPALLIGTILSGCGSSSPTTPTSTTPAQPPTASFTVSPGGQAIIGVTNMTFAASASSSSGAALTYSWDFGDGNTATGQNVSHLFLTENIFQITLKVSDGTNTTTSLGTVTARSLSGLWADPVKPAGFAWKFVQKGRHITGLDVTPRPAAQSINGILTDPRAITLEEDDGNYTFTGTVEKGLDGIDLTYSSPDGDTNIRIVRQ